MYSIARQYVSSVGYPRAPRWAPIGAETSAPMMPSTSTCRASWTKSTSPSMPWPSGITSVVQFCSAPVVDVQRKRPYARIRAAQRRLTGNRSVRICSPLDVGPDRGRKGIGADCPVNSMVWESCDRIIGDVPVGTLPLDRLHAIDDSFRQPAYPVRAGVNISVDQTDSKSVGKGGQVRRHLPA